MAAEAEEPPRRQRDPGSFLLFGITDFVSDFHVQVFEGCADLLAILSEERSKRGKAWWAGLSPAERQGY